MPAEDAGRESRIEDEIVVDCYTETERALGWYYYLKEKTSFPFKATCLFEVETSPLRTGEEVQVVTMAREEECMEEMKVRVQRDALPHVVPLRQLRCHSRSSKTKEAVQDWHYWLFRGYEF